MPPTSSVTSNTPPAESPREDNGRSGQHPQFDKIAKNDHDFLVLPSSIALGVERRAGSAQALPALLISGPSKYRYAVSDQLSGNAAMTTPPTIVIATPFARLGARIAAGFIQEIRFLPPETALQTINSPLQGQFESEIARYVADPHYRPQLPCAPRGTAFQQSVWHSISTIKTGKLKRYGDIARELNSAARAVGQACGANPFPIAVPCHRVLAQSGLGGFAHTNNGWLIDTKRWLLQHEGVLESFA